MMAPMSAAAAYRNPYELTALQIAAARVQLTFRSRHCRTAHQRLQMSDELLEHVERCRLQSHRFISGRVWEQVAALTNSVDPRLRLELGRDRHPDHVGEILFEVQARLMRAAQDERHRGLAPVIPLFRRP
jgi:hypothetical protein